METSRLLQRFLRYVAIDTMADEATTEYPSSAGQWTLGKLLVEELQEIGAADVEQDRHALIWATIPATPGCESAPVIAFNSHLDTSPETSGANVKPQVLTYEGGDIALPGDPTKVITIAENPELDALRGATLITTDGTTLLGGDDKAGVAVIMEMAAKLLEQPDLPHGPIRILFTCDEEIGRGIAHVDLQKLGATACYTLDGAGADAIDVETFSADVAVVRVRGVNIHPSIAKDRMVNALRAAGTFLDRMPREQAPERTEHRDGFLHPYHLEGGVAEATIRVLLRDFDSARLRDQEQLLRALAEEVEREHPGVTVDVEVRRQYRNIADGLRSEPRAVAHAQQALENLGRSPRLTIVRGGTDGSMLTEKGLPTPNLSTGQHNPHSPLEWACLDEMQQAATMLVELVGLWSQE